MYKLDSLKTNLKITYIQFGSITIEANSKMEIKLERKVSSFSDFRFLSTETGIPVQQETSVYDFTKDSLILQNNHPSRSNRQFIIFFIN